MLIIEKDLMRQLSTTVEVFASAAHDTKGHLSPWGECLKEECQNAHALMANAKRLLWRQDQRDVQGTELPVFVRDPLATKDLCRCCGSTPETFGARRLDKQTKLCVECWRVYVLGRPRVSVDFNPRESDT